MGVQIGCDGWNQIGSAEAASCVQVYSKCLLIQGPEAR